MYVEKFSGESIDEVLKNVKQKLGPDAIILKTMTNKGIKGAFKKSRIEITAAVKERDYEKKTRVDNVFDDQQKEEFYQASASSISNSIESYSASPASSYGRLGINKMVNTVTKTAQNAGEAIKSGLDEFLSAVPYDSDEQYGDDKSQILVDRQPQIPTPIIQETPVSNENRKIGFELPENSLVSQAPDDARSENVNRLEERIQELEGMLLQMNDVIREREEQRVSENKDDIYEEIRTVLSGVGLNSGIIKESLKAALFNLSEEEKNDFDIVFEYILKYIHDRIEVKMPLFSNSDLQNDSVITLMLSDGFCGQTSQALKIALMKKGTKVISYGALKSSKSYELSRHLHEIDYKEIENTSEIYYECRKAVAEGYNLVIDYRCSNTNNDEVKQLATSVKRSFSNVETIVTTSGIHGEDYNRKIISKYKEFSDGVIISHVDQCLNFGALVNINFGTNLPFVFFGTGECVPNDIESASSERIMAGMFKF